MRIIECSNPNCDEARNSTAIRHSHSVAEPFVSLICQNCAAEKARADSLQAERDESNRMLLKATEDFKGMLALCQKEREAREKAEGERDAWRRIGERDTDALAAEKARADRLQKETDDACRVLDSICEKHKPSEDWPSLRNLTCASCRNDAESALAAEQERRAGGPAYIREEVCAERIANIVREMDDAYAALAAAQARIEELEKALKRLLDEVAAVTKCRLESEPAAIAALSPPERKEKE